MRAPCSDYCETKGLIYFARMLPRPYFPCIHDSFCDAVTEVSGPAATEGAIDGETGVVCANAY